LNGLCLGLLGWSAWAGEPALQRQEANMGPGCRIAASFPARLKATLSGAPNIGLPRDPKAGLGAFIIDPPLPKAWHSTLYDLSVNLTCENLDSKSFDPLVRLNPATGQWEKDHDYLASIFDYNTSDEEYRAYVAAIRVVNLTAVNSTGYVVTQNQTMGIDEEFRQRQLFFCLPHPPKLLCGSGVVANLRELPRGDLTPHVLDILRSIEFLPDAPTNHPASRDAFRLLQPL
jgi:hypothetical protein